MPLLLSQTTYTPSQPTQTTVNRIVNAVIAVFSVIGIVYVVKTIRNTQKERNRRGRMKKAAPVPKYAIEPGMQQQHQQQHNYDNNNNYNNNGAAQYPQIEGIPDELIHPSQPSQASLSHYVQCGNISHHPHTHVHHPESLHAATAHPPPLPTTHTHHSHHSAATHPQHITAPDLPDLLLVSSDSLQNFSTPSISSRRSSCSALAPTSFCSNCCAAQNAPLGGTTPSTSAMFFDFLNIYANVEQIPHNNNNNSTTSGTADLPPLSLMKSRRAQSLTAGSRQLPYNTQSVPVSPTKSALAHRRKSTHLLDGENFLLTTPQITHALTFSADATPIPLMMPNNTPAPAVSHHAHTHIQTPIPPPSMHPSSAGNHSLHTNSLLSGYSHSSYNSHHYNLPTQPFHQRRSSFNYDERNAAPVDPRQSKLSREIAATLLQQKQEKSLPDSLRNSGDKKANRKHRRSTSHSSVVN